MPGIKFEIIEQVAILSESSKGWKKEVNLISWNNREPKYDIRDWAPNHEKMGKGVTLSLEEWQALKEFMKKH
ncbi:YdbC family protein [Gracilibacillus sp. HCP3S3_G5_1]|uniref:YdbC family protein n=1 Tax=unclassified Gracilibacillus TaxID=2625209 RepID=UPI003F8CF220